MRYPEPTSNRTVERKREWRHRIGHEVRRSKYRYLRDKGFKAIHARKVQWWSWDNIYAIKSMDRGTIV